MARQGAAAAADVLALEALAFLADSPDDLALFIRLSGVDPAGLRARAGERQFLAGVLDYFLGDEKLLTRFCQQNAVEPATIHRLRAALAAQPPETR
ncbi:MAG: DUF3572 family protein [Rhizomicrobium sp.]